MRQIQWLGIIYLLLILSSCKYLQGPAGSDGQPKVNNFVINIMIDGDSSSTVFHSTTSSVIITWDLVTETGSKFFEIDYNGDGIADILNISSYSYLGAVPGFFTDNTLYSIRIRSIDKTGNIGEWSGSKNLFVDTQPPTTPGACTFSDNSSLANPNGDLSCGASTDAGSGISYYRLTLTNGTLTSIYRLYPNGSGLSSSTFIERNDSGMITGITTSPSNISMTIHFSTAGNYSGNIVAVDRAGHASSAQSISSTTINP